MEFISAFPSPSLKLGKITSKYLILELFSLIDASKTTRLTFIHSISRSYRDKLLQANFNLCLSMLRSSADVKVPTIKELLNQKLLHQKIHKKCFKIIEPLKSKQELQSLAKFMTDGPGMKSELDQFELEFARFSTGNQQYGTFNDLESFRTLKKLTLNYKGNFIINNNFLIFLPKSITKLKFDLTSSYGAPKADKIHKEISKVNIEEIKVITSSFNQLAEILNKLKVQKRLIICFLETIDVNKIQTLADQIGSADQPRELVLKFKGTLSQNVFDLFKTIIVKSKKLLP